MTSSELFVIFFFVVTLGLAAWAMTVALSYGIELVARSAFTLVSKARTSLAERRAQRKARSITAL